MNKIETKTIPEQTKQHMTKAAYKVTSKYVLI